MTTPSPNPDDVTDDGWGTPLPRRTLRAMQARWERDYDRLEAAYGDIGPGQDSRSETLRNLATAIAEINGMITRRRKGEPQ